MEAPLSSPTQRTQTAASHWPQAATKGYAVAAPAVAGHRQQAKQASSASPSTDAFLKDFTLVAEAAKRAQVAVMVRDFENIGLS
ncbi:hypothetical protein N8I77_002656 [Diaporthe amygdali]|uniref:Uncharacterized protein n=1 Tax=Phomopsis amygdali TaxID=1214568 RepID=A0AAD9SV89_PHOAM|nr:uncharacterized protein J7T55_000903 [Diaporthe amygdali]KAJ0120050.1 hypothetical protein J7T55_000903 [Diaporthe amygdali]KAK2615935.1 hypothetical protein N8I77_002656 [Diaporthe amygdali]